MTATDSLFTGRRGGICVSVPARDTESAVSAVRKLKERIDVVEIRLDAMGSYDIPELCRSIDHPLLFTNRPTWEGGHCEQTEEERIVPLLEACREKAAFVDLELRTDHQHRSLLLREANASGARVILSYHDFEKTPSPETLSDIFNQQAESGAQIGKIVTMAHSPFDVLQVLNLQCEAHEKNFPLIAFCMGEAGRLSRIITLFLGGFLTYASLDEQQATAPGQLSVRKLREALALLAR